MEELTLDSIASIKLYQHKRGYRFSIDSVILADFVRTTKNTRNIIDLGAGSGIVGLLIAQKHPDVRVRLVEIQKGLFELSVKNIKINGLQERVNSIHADIRLIPWGRYNELTAQSADIVVSNPPFRKPGTGLISPSNERAIARHEFSLNLEQLILASSYLLKNRGRLFLIYHPHRLADLIHTMRSNSLEPKRIRFVHPKKHKDANMVLMEAIKAGGVELKVQYPLIVYNDDGSYTEEVKKML